MESNIRSSFIPQAPVSAPTPGARRSSGGGFDMLMLLALVLFIASAVLAVGVFLYVQYEQAAAASKLDQLQRAKAAFEPALIAELTRLDDRMRAADDVLASHIAPSTVFKLLEQLTLQTVAFNSFDFTAQNNNELSLTMQGLAQSVNSIALQADLLSKSGVVVNPIFSNINRTLSGVRFDFTASVNANKLRYRTTSETATESALNPEQQVPGPFGLPPEATGPGQGSPGTQNGL